MSAIKPILRELKQAALRGGVHAKDKLHQVTDNMNDHLDNVVRQVRDLDRYDDTVDVNIRPFTQNPNHSSQAFHTQYNEQMDTLQRTSAGDWLRNRIDYLEHGRTPASVRAQQNAREVALRDEIVRLREADPSLSRRGAEAQAREWMKTQAALHRLDGIAGGDATDISGVGDAGVNSSLGSQWRSRVGDIDRAIIDFVNNNPGVNLDDVSINVILR
jgi:hypothetical protein